MKLTLRDLFWLALFVASVTVWVVELYRAAELERYPRHLIEIFGGARASDEELKRQSALADFTLMTDEELDEYFGSLPPNKLYQVAKNRYQRSVEYEPCVVEMARRGLVGRLQKHYDALMAQGAGKSGFDFPNNLEILTALRRAEGKPDPLIINAMLNGSRRLGSKFQSPAVRATIENVDVGKEAVTLQQGGDYRGGRLGRWRFVLTDEQGRRAADSGDLWSDGDGMSQTAPLPYGARSRWGYEFDLRSYLAPPPSGKYELQALYHDNNRIAHERDVSGLIVVKSKPISVLINNRESPIARQRWIKFPAPLGILAACVVLSLASITAEFSCSKQIGGSETRRAAGLLGIARRDFYWGLVVVAITLGIWLTDGGQKRWNEGLYQRPDAAANWSIRLADDVKP